MRIWFSGPRMFGGLIRPGVSFGREDWRWLTRRAARRTGLSNKPHFVFVARGPAGVRVGAAADPRAALQAGESLAYVGAVKSDDGTLIARRAGAALAGQSVTAAKAVGALGEAAFELSDAIVRVEPRQIGDILRIAAAAPLAASNGKPPLLLRVAAVGVLLIAIPVFVGGVALLILILKNLDWSAFTR